MQTQQVQPCSIIMHMQSQHFSIILAHAASPLVQVIVQPDLVISHLAMPIIILQHIIIMPFIIMQQLIMEPDMALQRFFIISAATSSLLVHMIFMPPAHFSMRIVQRGIIIMFIIGAEPPMGIIVAWLPIIMLRSIIQKSSTLRFSRGVGPS
jgi:hypothetical protein